MKLIVSIIVILAAFAASLAAMNVWRDPASYRVDWRLAQPPAKEVQCELPSRGQVIQTLTAPGTIEPVDEAEIASQIVARVISVEVEQGDPVKQGELLVKLDDTEARAQLDSIVARMDVLRKSIETAGADLTKAERDVTRHSKLIEKQASSQMEFDDARTMLTKAKASLDISQHQLSEAEANYRSLQQNLEYTEIRAPIDGVIVDLEVEVGEIVIPGTTNLPGTVLMRVADLTRMRVRASVDETDVLLVEAGQAAKIYLQAEQQKPIAGLVDRVAPSGTKLGDVVSFETFVKIEKHDPRLRAGLTATVEIEVRRVEDALRVPVQAVVHRRRKDLPDRRDIREAVQRQARLPGEKPQGVEARYLKIVFVKEGDVARARPLQTGLSDERRVEILGGMNPQEQIIVGPFRVLDELKDGQRVKLVETTEQDLP
jgi:HlyD family secretion protein